MRGWFRSTVWGAALLSAGCTSSKGPAPSPDAVPTVTITLQERDAIRDQLLTAAARVQQLERRLAIREKQINAALTEIDELRTAVEVTDLSGLGLGARGGHGPPPSPGAVPADRDRSQEDVTPAADQASAIQLAELKRQLDEERRKRTELEQDLENLKIETSSGPFESRIQKDLEDARAQIERLEAALQVERQARERITREYDEAKSKMPASGEAQDQENVDAVRAAQDRLLATLRRQLEESERREQDLRDGLTAVQGENAIGLAITVADLEAENDALQLRLDDEHVRNEELETKLRAAMRAADLVFRMNSRPAVEPPP